MGDNDGDEDCEYSGAEMVMVMRMTMMTFGRKRRTTSNACVRSEGSPSSEMKRMNDRYQGVNFHAEGVSCF